MLRARLLSGVMWIAASLLASAAFSQEYPTRPVRIVTAAAGGGGDIVARLIAQALGTPLGQQVVVDNRGGGFVPPEIVAKAAPDGYTLLLYGNSLWLGPILQTSAPYDAIKDFAPIILATKAPQVLVVHPSLPVRSVRDLIALANAKPGELNYASVSIGSTTHVAAELFKSMTHVNMVGISYKAEGTALIDVLGGHVPLIFGSAAGVSPYIKSNRLRALAVTSAQPSTLLPDLPTIASAGLPGYEAVAMFGLLAPARTSPAIILRLNQETARVLTQSDMKQRFLQAGVEAAGSSTEQFGSAIRNEMTTMARVFKEAGITAN